MLVKYMKWNEKLFDIIIVNVRILVEDIYYFNNFFVFKYILKIYGCS